MVIDNFAIKQYLLETKIDESRIGRGQWTGGVRCTEKAKQRLKVRLIFCASRAAL